MRVVYLLLGMLVFPMLHLRAIVNRFRNPRLRTDLSGRWGYGPMLPAQGIWVHAVSVGEVNLAEIFLRLWRARHPQAVLGLTVSTATGFIQAQQIRDIDLKLSYLPYDLPWALRRFFKRTQPALLVIMETELWPNLFATLQQLKIPSAIINAKISPRSVRRLQLVKPLLAACRHADPLILAQSPADAARFEELGFNPTRISVAGQLKRAVLSAEVGPTAPLWSALTGRPVWVAGSTREGEEALCLAAHRQLLKTHPDAVLILAPRHPPRFDAVWQEIVASGLRGERRSHGAWADSVQVVLLDSLGELKYVYPYAPLSLVGGTLVPVGGHNPLEAIAAASYLLTGPYVANIAPMVESLAQLDAIDRVHNAAELARCLAQRFAQLSDTRERARHARQQLVNDGNPLLAVCATLERFMAS